MQTPDELEQEIAVLEEEILPYPYLSRQDYPTPIEYLNHLRYLHSIRRREPVAFARMQNWE